MPISISRLTEKDATHHKFIDYMHASLVHELGDHKWLVQVVNEKENPDVFNLSDEEFSAKFLCYKECVCGGGGSGCEPDEYGCDCLLSTPRVALRVQYNAKFGDVDTTDIEGVVEKTSKHFGFSDSFPFVDVKVLDSEAPQSTYASDALMDTLTALTCQGLAAEELVKRVLFTVRDSLPRKSKSRVDVADIANAWVNKK